MCFVLQFIGRGVRDNHTLLPSAVYPSSIILAIGRLDLLLKGAFAGPSGRWANARMPKGVPWAVGL
jgi:hypothetical protein